MSSILADVQHNRFKKAGKKIFSAGLEGKHKKQEVKERKRST